MRLPARTALGLVLLAIAALLTGSAGAAGQEGILVRAHKGSYVDVTVHETVDISEADIRIATRGRYAGFYLLPHFATHEPVGALWSPRLGADGKGGRLIALGSGWEVTAGSYRLYVFAEAPTEIFIPLPGSAFRAYRTTHLARVSVNQSGFVVPPAADGGSQRLPAAAQSKRTLVTAVSYATSPSLTGADLASSCLAARGKGCAPTALPVTRLPGATARTIVSGERTAGRYEAVFEVSRTPGVHADTKVATLVLVLNP